MLKSSRLSSRARIPPPWMTRAASTLLAADPELFARHECVAGVLAVDGDAQLRIGGQRLHQVRCKSEDRVTRVRAAARNVANADAGEVELSALAAPGGRVADARRGHGHVGHEIGAAADRAA